MTRFNEEHLDKLCKGSRVHDKSFSPQVDNFSRTCTKVLEEDSKSFSPQVDKIPSSCTRV